MRAATKSPAALVEEFFDRDVSDLQRVLSEIETRIPATQAADCDATLDQLTQAIDRCLSACERVAEALGDDESQLLAVRARFREAIRPWFEQSWFMHRGTTKPRGFAGDYMILNAIYENVPKVGGVGGYLDRYFLKSDLARAVRSRLDCVQKFLVRETLDRAELMSILDVASGPGREFTSVFSGRVDSAKAMRTKFIALKCIDIDQEALDHLRDRVDADAKDAIDVSCHRYNALRMSSVKANLQNFGECDMIYSVGLCDYIPDRQMIAILSGWRGSVNPHGIVYVAFKDVTRYRPAQNQWLVDWHFFPRVEADCRRLFTAAGYDADALEMFRDETGVIMNFVARQPALRRARVDAIERLAGPHFPRSGGDPTPSDTPNDLVTA